MVSSSTISMRISLAPMLYLYGRRLRVGCRARLRQADDECGATAGRGFDFDLAGVVGDDAVDDGQAQADAFALLFGREERLEDLPPRPFVHTDAVVRDANLGDSLIGQRL